MLLGGSGNDVLNGGKVANLMLGDAGMDRLVGGREGDVLVGGSASETNVNALVDILKD